MASYVQPHWFTSFNCNAGGSMLHLIVLFYFIFFYVCRDAVIHETGRDNARLRSHTEPTLIDSSKKRS